MKSFMKTAAILGTCFFMAGAFAEGTTSGKTTGTSDNYNADMRNPQNTDTTRSPSSNIPSGDTDTTGTYSQGTGISTTDDTTGMNAMNDRTQVRSVQSALSSRGYDVAVDGIAGKNTKNAISRFQRDQGLTETGRIDDATLRALNLDSSTDRIPSSIDDSQMGD